MSTEGLCWSLGAINMTLITTTRLVWFTYQLFLVSLSVSFSVLPTYRSRRHALYTSPTRLLEAGDFFDEISSIDEEETGDDNEENTKDPGELTKEEHERLMAAAGEWDERVPKLNTVTLSGRVGNDPDPKYFDDGNVVLNLSLAVKRKYHPLERQARDIKSGEEETDWFPLEIWGRTAEYTAKFVEKGSRIGVTGSMKVDHWNDKDSGEPRERAKIIVQHLDILETKAEAELRRQNRQGPAFYRRDKQNDDDESGGFSPAGTGGFFD